MVAGRALRLSHCASRTPRKVPEKQYVVGYHYARARISVESSRRDGGGDEVGKVDEVEEVARREPWIVWCNWRRRAGGG